MEVGHPGDGSPIPAPQRKSLLLVNAALCEFLGLDPLTQVIGHKEWTRRKIDPRWGWEFGPDSMDEIRRDTADVLAEGAGMPKTQWHQLIDSLFAGRPDVFMGDPNYWKAMPSDSSEWVDFWNAFVRVLGGDN